MGGSSSGSFTTSTGKGATSQDFSNLTSLSPTGGQSEQQRLASMVTPQAPTTTPTTPSPVAPMPTSPAQDSSMAAKYNQLRMDQEGLAKQFASGGVPAAAPAKPAASPTPQASYAMGDPFSSGQATAYDAYKTGGGQESFNPYASGISNGSDFARRQFGAFK